MNKKTSDFFEKIDKTFGQYYPWLYMDSNDNTEGGRKEMGFFSDLLGIEKPKEQRTRADMEDKLFVLNKRTNGQKRGAQDSEKQILKEVFDIIEEVPETKKLLDDVAKMGYKFFFMKETGNIDAECIPNDKLIMLNPTKYKHVSNMAIDIVHEMTHAMQAKEYADMGNEFSGLNLADQMKVHRAKEAGACLEQSKFAVQILDKHPESAKYVQNDLTMSTYKNEMEKSGDKTKAAAECFKSWYSKKYETSEAYDDLQVDLCIQDIDHTRHKDKILQQSISAEKIIRSSVYSPELKSAIPPEFLDSPEANKLTLKAKERLDTVSKKCDKYFGVKDASYKEMYSYDSGMKHKDQEKDTSLMSQLKAKQAEADAQKKAAEPAKTETKQASAGATLMGMLAGIAVDMAVGAAKKKVTDTVKSEILKAKTNGR